VDDLALSTGTTPVVQTRIHSVRAAGFGGDEVTQSTESVIGVTPA
jgi:hypothetical protein